MNNNIIEVFNLTKRYKTPTETIIPLNNINFYAKNGEFILIYGPSGSGKTTFLNILSGIDYPDEGQLFFKGEPYHNKSDKELTIMRRWNIGVIFQSFELIKVMSCYDNIIYPLILQGKIEKKQIKEKVSFYSNNLEIDNILNRKPSEISGGQSQRVAICRALIADYPLILGDEITSNLDFDTTIKVYDFLFSLSKKEGKTFIMVSHDIELKKYCDRILILREGSLCKG